MENQCYGLYGRCCANCKHTADDNNGWSMYCHALNQDVMAHGLCNSYAISDSAKEATPGSWWTVTYYLVDKDYRGHYYYVLIKARSKHEAIANMRYELSRRTNRSPRGVSCCKTANLEASLAIAATKQDYPSFGEFMKR